MAPSAPVTLWDVEAPHLVAVVDRLSFNEFFFQCGGQSRASLIQQCLRTGKEARTTKSTHPASSGGDRPSPFCDLCP